MCERNTIADLEYDLKNLQNLKDLRLIEKSWCVWCDECIDYVNEFIPAHEEILCGNCRNALLIKRPEKTRKELRISLAKAIWGL